ncbi:MAG: dTDP-4-dehydrorhamnose reductase [Ignavibacteria bacterium]|nr:dTDP-4-dehydrorhamnose reductase [Ignavibacteria bacterium]
MIWLVGNKGMLGIEMQNALKYKNFSFISSDLEVDITKIEKLREFVEGKEIDWIINCSAYTNVEKAEDEAALAFQINAEGVKNLSEIAKEKNAKLIHISTDYVFDGESLSLYYEEDEPNPQNIYGLSKLAGENLVKKTLKSHFIIRISWLIGFYKSNFLYSILKQIENKDSLNIVSDQFGSPTFAADLVEFIVFIIKQDSNEFGIYHFSSEGKISWFDFAEKIYKLAKQYKITEKNVQILPVPSSEYPTKAKRPPNSYLSKEKLSTTFGIKAPFWLESLELFIKELKEII